MIVTVIFCQRVSWPAILTAIMRLLWTNSERMSTVVFDYNLWGTAYQFQSRGLDCYRMVLVNPTWTADSKLA